MVFATLKLVVFYSHLSISYPHKFVVASVRKSKMIIILEFIIYLLYYYILYFIESLVNV